MAFPEAKCANCGSIDTQAGLHHFQCLVCGRLTSYDGDLLPPEPEFNVSQTEGPWRNNVAEETEEVSSGQADSSQTEEHSQV
jgi:hypothetical protein